MIGSAFFLADGLKPFAPLLPVEWHAWVTGLVVIAVLFLLVTERLSPDLSMLAGLSTLLVCGVIQPQEGLAGFADPAMLAVGALFVFAAAIRNSGALSFLGHLMRPRSRSMPMALARVMLPSSLLSAFMNNTPIVAFLTPLVEGWSHRAGISRSKLLMPLSFATILGGMGTLVGTSTNLVVSSLLERQGHKGFEMFELLWIGGPCAVLGFFYFVAFGHRLLPVGDADRRGAAQRRDYQFDLVVPDSSTFVGQSIEAVGLRQLKDAFLAHVFRHGEMIGPIQPNQTLEAGDVLTFYGNSEVIDIMLGSGDLSRPEELADHKDSAPGLPLFEAVVAPESSLVGATLKSADFRERFQGVVLGIHRRGRRLPGSVGQSRIDAGDLLLIEARPGFEARWLNRGEFYLVAPIARLSVGVTRHAWKVLAILVAMIASISFGLLPVVTAAFAATMLVILVGALRPADARHAVDLSVLIVIASAFGIGSAITSSGLGQALGEAISDLSSGLGVIGALALVYLATSFLTEVLTNSVAAALMFPIGMSSAVASNVDPRAFAIAIAIAASASFVTPIGYQTNLMVMSPGGYRYRDYIKTGLPLSILVMALSLWVIQWRWL